MRNKYYHAGRVHFNCYHFCSWYPKKLQLDFVEDFYNVKGDDILDLFWENQPDNIFPIFVLILLDYIGKSVKHQFGVSVPLKVTHQKAAPTQARVLINTVVREPIRSFRLALWYSKWTKSVLLIWWILSTQHKPTTFKVQCPNHYATATSVCVKYRKLTEDDWRQNPSNAIGTSAVLFLECSTAATGSWFDVAWDWVETVDPISSMTNVSFPASAANSAKSTTSWVDPHRVMLLASTLSFTSVVLCCKPSGCWRTRRTLTNGCSSWT